MTQQEDMKELKSEEEETQEQETEAFPDTTFLGVSIRDQIAVAQKLAWSLRYGRTRTFFSDWSFRRSIQWHSMCFGPDMGAAERTFRPL